MKPICPIHKRRAQRRLSVSSVQESLKQSDSDNLLQASDSTPKILLVDNDPGVREILQRILEAEHYQVIAANSGEDAAAKVACDSPDLLLIDPSMPDQDGWPVFLIMKARDRFIPVIVVAARSNLYRKAAEFCVDAFMEKPLDIFVLLKSIKGFLAESKCDRRERLSNPDFATAFLKPSSEIPGEGV